MASYVSIIVAFGKYVDYLRGKVKATNEQCKILIDSIEPLKDILTELQTTQTNNVSTKIVRRLEIGLDKLMRYLLKATKKNFIKRGMGISKERNKIKSYVDNIIILIGEHNMATLIKLNVDMQELPSKISNSMGKYLEDQHYAKFEDLKKFVQESNQTLMAQITEGINQRKNRYCETLNIILKNEIIAFETFWIKFLYSFYKSDKIGNFKIDKAKAALKYYFALNSHDFDVKKMIRERQTMIISPIFLDDINIFLGQIWDYKFSKKLFIEKQIIIPSLENDDKFPIITFLSLSDSFTPGGVTKGSRYFVDREISNNVIPFISDDYNPIAYLEKDDFCWYLTPAKENCQIYYLLETSVVLKNGLSVLINCGYEFLTLEIPLNSLSNPLDSLSIPKNSVSFVGYSRAYQFDLVFNTMKKKVQGNLDIFRVENEYVLEKSNRNPSFIQFEGIYYIINKIPDVDIWVNVCEGNRLCDTKFLLDSTTTLFMNRKEFKIIYSAE